MCFRGNCDIGIFYRFCGRKSLLQKQTSESLRFPLRPFCLSMPYVFGYVGDLDICSPFDIVGRVAVPGVGRPSPVKGQPLTIYEPNRLHLSVQCYTRI